MLNATKDDILDNLKTDLENFLFYQRMLTKNIKYFYGLAYKNLTIDGSQVHEVSKCVREMARQILNLKDRTFSIIHDIDENCDKVEGYSNIISEAELMDYTKISEDPESLLVSTQKSRVHNPKHNYFCLDYNDNFLYIGGNKGRIFYYDKQTFMSKLFLIEHESESVLNVKLIKLKKNSFQFNEDKEIGNGEEKKNEEVKDLSNESWKGEYEEKGHSSNENKDNNEDEEDEEEYIILISQNLETDEKNGKCSIIKNLNSKSKNDKIDKKVLYHLNENDPKFENFDLNKPNLISNEYIPGILGKKSSNTLIYKNLFDSEDEMTYELVKSKYGKICNIKNIIGEYFIVQTEQAIILFRNGLFLHHIVLKNRPSVIFSSLT